MLAGLCRPIDGEVTEVDIVRKQHPVDPQNPFLILQLPANASSADIKRAGQMAVAAARLSGDSSAQAQGHLRSIEGAMERLRDPVSRLRYGTMWPALGPSGAGRLRSDVRFQEILRDPATDSSDAVDALVAEELPHVQAHARAVFALLRAAAILQARTRDARSPSENPGVDLATGCKLLRGGLRQWTAAVGRREFWLEWRLRAKDLDDPRINGEFLSREEADAPSMPLAQFAEIAREMLRVRDGAGCKALVQAMRTGALAAPRLDAVLSEIYGPTCVRASATIEGLSGELSRLKSRSSDPYRSLMSRFSREVLQDLELLLEVGDLPGYSEEVVRDKATTVLLSLAVTAANNAMALDVSESALAIAARVANSAALRARVSRDRATVDQLIGQSPKFSAIRSASNRLSRAMAAGDVEEAIIAVNDLVAHESGERLAELKAQRSNLMAALSERRLKEGVALARAGRSDEAVHTLQRARTLEHRAAQLVVIDIAIASAFKLTRQSLREVIRRLLDQVAGVRAR
jgi:hypothetical protein